MTGYTTKDEAVDWARYFARRDGKTYHVVMELDESGEPRWYVGDEYDLDGFYGGVDPVVSFDARGEEVT